MKGCVHDLHLAIVSSSVEVESREHALDILRRFPLRAQLADHGVGLQLICRPRLRGRPQRGLPCNFTRDTLVHWGDDLATVVPVHLVPVVLLGIVRSRDHDPCPATQLPRCEREQRRRHQRVKDVNFQTAAREAQRRRRCELEASFSPVEADADAGGVFPLSYLSLLGNVVRDPLARQGHRHRVHAIPTSTLLRPQARRSERQGDEPCRRHGERVSLPIPLSRPQRIAFHQRIPQGDALGRGAELHSMRTTRSCFRQARPSHETASVW